MPNLDLKTRLMLRTIVGDTTGALQDCESLIQNDRRNAYFLCFSSYLKDMTDRLDESLVDAEKAHALDRKDHIVLQRLAEARRLVGGFVGAYDAFESNWTPTEWQRF